MDKSVVLPKLESLRRCVGRVRSKTPASVEILMDDCDLQDIICVNLERAIQLCVDVAAHLLADLDVPAPESMGASFDELNKQRYLPKDLALRMKKAVGFRNISVHAYHEIDWAIVYSIITERLSDFSAYASCVIDKLDPPAV